MGVVAVVVVVIVSVDLVVVNGVVVEIVTVQRQGQSPAWEISSQSMSAMPQ